jgi:hypothetical protein
MPDTTNQLKGLVISEPWISHILTGEKTWEMRSKVTSYRGPLAIIRKGTGAVVGMVDLIDCIPGQHEAEYGASEALHCIPMAQHKDCAARWPIAWVFANARSLSEPVLYKHKNGAQSQVILSDKESMAVRTHAPTALGKANTSKSISLTESAPEFVKVASLGRWEIRLVTANIKNHTLPVRSIVLPPDVIGGSNRDHVAPEMLTVIYEGRSTRSDVDGIKWILRDRRASGNFFSLTKAKAGDIVVVDKLADYVYAIRLKRRASK